jgi:hypothetical protein
MNLKMFLMIAAAIAVFYGIAFLLIPNFVMTFYSITTSAPAILMSRFFGVALLSLGLVTWFLTVTSDWTALRGLRLGNRHGDHERNRLVGSADISCAVRGMRLLSVRWSRRAIIRLIGPGPCLTAVIKSDTKVEIVIQTVSGKPLILQSSAPKSWRRA